MATLALTQKQIDQIAERWSATAWDEHEKAFARQWMTQAQEDVATLVADLRLALTGAKALFDAITRTVQMIDGGEVSADLRAALDGSRDLYEAIGKTLHDIEDDPASKVGT